MSIVELFVIFAVAALVFRPKDWQLCIDKFTAFTRRIRGYQQTFQQMIFEKLHFDVDNVENSTKPDIFPEIDVSNVGNVKKGVGKKSRKKVRKVKISTKPTKPTGK
jgi:Sec-independent protein translocase protein TatA